MPQGQKPYLAKGASGPPEPLDVVRDLHLAVFRDVSEMVGYDCARDIETILTRYTSEGFAFLSKTLPSFGDAIFAATKSGALCQTLFSRARRNNIRLALPAFTLGLLSRVFDPLTGVLLPDGGDTSALRALRQLCYFSYKYEMPFDDALVRKSYRELLDVDSSLPASLHEFDFRRLFPKDDSDYILIHANLLLGELFDGVDLLDINPRHGPGATNAPIEPYQKYDFQYYSTKLNDVYPKSIYAQPSLFEGLVRNPEMRNVCVVDGKRTGIILNDQRKTDEENRIADEDSIQMEFKSRCSKIVPVPKNSKSLRVISSESESNQWIQQGQGRRIVELAESHPLTRGRVNFSDQTINRKLALAGSRHGNLATIDMSKASDRNSRSLVYCLWPRKIFRALDASRSEFSSMKWPDGCVSFYKLNKFAPMGSSTCFPVEALTFWALVVSAIHVKARVSLEIALESVYVYGDDIIVPSIYADIVYKALPFYGLVVNEKKSFETGYFRESCGLDAYRGEEITPLRLKSRVPDCLSSAESLVGWVDFANLCYERGYFSTFCALQQRVEAILGPLPWTRERVKILTWVDNKCETPGIPEIDMLDPAVPYFGGVVIRGWTKRSSKVQPDDESFSDSMAWLRWVSYTSSTPGDNVYPAKAIEPRVFDLPHTVSLVRGLAILT